MTHSKRLCITDGVAVPVTIYDPSNELNNFIQLPGKSLMWQGGNFTCYSAVNFKQSTHSGGYIPKDAPSPKAQGDNQFEIIIAAIATSLGIMSTIYFFGFNIYHRNNL